MSLEVIYVTRHGFRSSWTVNHKTGEYTAALVTPTGIPSDPELTSHGVDQAKQLGRHLRGVDPPIERVYSSPYYRCLQTIEPFVSLSQRSAGLDGDSTDGHGDRKAKGEAEGEGEGDFAIKAEPGVGEWYGSAHFEHPTSAAPEVLKAHFPAIDLSYQPFTRPPRRGESLTELHDRVAATLQDIVAQCDRDGVRAIVICTHAAVVIALGRVLTGKMPKNVEDEDFRAFTCGLSIYQRKTADAPVMAGSGAKGVKINKINTSLSSRRASGDSAGARETKKGTRGNSGPDMACPVPTASTTMTPHPTSGGTSPLPKIRAERSSMVPAWKGCGVAGGWDCIANSDCSHLPAGEERGWRFSGDEAFASLTDAGVVEVGMGVVVEGKKATSAGTVSRL